jgi:hypothetical protein
MIVLSTSEATNVIGGRKWKKTFRKIAKIAAPIALSFVPGVGPALSIAASSAIAISDRRKGGVKNTLRVGARAALQSIAAGKAKSYALGLARS